jgi:hypothetical protein
MFDPTSRYHAIETVTMDGTDNDGALRRIAYKKRRFIPSVEGAQTLAEHTITQGERLDNVTARYLGDPTQFWRVCDANNVLSPDELEETGTVVRITLPNM